MKKKKTSEYLTDHYRNLLKNTSNKSKANRALKNLASIYTKTLFTINKGWAAQLGHFIKHGHVVRRVTIRRYLKNIQYPRLQVGGGKHTLEGWLNGDIIEGDIYLDATKPLPFPDNSFNYIFAEQFIEHITLRETGKFIGGCYRILKEGGKIRFSTPDLKKIVKIYLGTSSLVDKHKVIERHNRAHGRKVKTFSEFINEFFRLWGHRFIYDYETLSRVLVNNGFKNIERKRFGVSRVTELKNLERHAGVEWMKDGLTLIVEAEK